MRILNEKREEIKESDIDLEKGKLYVKKIVKPDVAPVDNIKKFAYSDDDYEEVQIYERIPDEILTKNRIAELKRMLSDTDYMILKIVEGASTLTDYAETIVKRKAWRDEINLLESQR